MKVGTMKDAITIKNNLLMKSARAREVFALKRERSDLRKLSTVIEIALNNAAMAALKEEVMLASNEVESMADTLINLDKKDTEAAKAAK